MRTEPAPSTDIDRPDDGPISPHSTAQRLRKRFEAIWTTARRGGVEFIALVAVAGCAVLFFSDSVRVPFAGHWRNPIVLDSSTKSFGVVRQGETGSVSFRLLNQSRRPVRVVGCMAYCECVVPDDLPFTIGPGEAREFRVSVRTVAGEFSKSPEKVNQPITLYTTDAGQAEIRLDVEGTVMDSGSTEGTG